MITNPHRCVGKTLHFFIDNIAVVFSFKKRRSNDRLAHTIIRAAYLVAGALACKLFVSWTPRRLDVESILADDLTHMDFSTFLALDTHTYMSNQPFPSPIAAWMKDPHTTGTWATPSSTGWQTHTRTCCECQNTHYPKPVIPSIGCCNLVRPI